MRWSGWLIGEFWRTTRASGIGGFRPGSGAAALYAFLFVVFLCIGTALVLFGIDLGTADRWIDRQTGWIEAIANVAMRVLFALVFLACALVVLMALFQRVSRALAWGRSLTGRGARRQIAKQQSKDRIGWGVTVFALIIGYFAAFGAFF